MEIIKKGLCVCAKWGDAEFKWGKRELFGLVVVTVG